MLLCANNTMAQDYIIASENDWNTFADNVSNGTESYEGKIVKLTADITVTTMVGNKEHPFKGTFYGCGHTLTFNIGTSSSFSNEEYLAPFRYTDGATFKFLNITGSFFVNKANIGGLIARASGNTSIVNCHCSVAINSTFSGYAPYVGGFVSRMNGSMVITNCLFNGSFITNQAKRYWGGFVSDWDYTKGTLKLQNCEFVPLETTKLNELYYHNFVYSYTNNATITNCYYSNSDCNYGISVGDMNVEQLASALGTGWKIDGTSVVPNMDGKCIDIAIIQGIHDNYAYTGNEINLDYKVIDALGDEINSKDYTSTLYYGNSIVDQVIAPGNYILKIEANSGSEVSGSTSLGFRVYPTSLIGDGSPSNPYKIGSAADWDRFTEIIAGTNGATKQSDACAILTDNVPNATEQANGIIDVTTMVNSKYQGTFNGAGHTLTISYGTEDNRVGNVSPFMACENATIKYLHVDGNIYTKQKATSGLVNYIYNSYILSCWSSVSINNSINDYIMGIASEGYGENTFNNCLFDGELISYYQPDGGMFTSGDGWIGCFTTNAASATITNCLVNPQNIQIRKEATINTFYKSGTPKSFSNNYYLGISGANQGIDASSMTPEELVAALGPGWMVDENNNVVPIMDISNLASAHISLPDIVFWQGGEPIILDYKVTDFENNELIEGTQYTSIITKDGKTVSEIIDEGDYILTLTATSDGGYTGKKTQKFHVGDGLNKDENGNYYVVMPEIGTKTVMPRGKEDGFAFTIYNPRHPNSFGSTSDGSIIINAQGYTMSINGVIYSNFGSDWVDDVYFEFYNGTKANNASPSYKTEGNHFHSQSMQFTPEGEQTEICFISGAHSAERFALTVTLTAIPYNITYNLNGGTPGEGHFTTYTTDMDYLPVTPIREGYVFAGWYTNEDFSGSPLKSLRGSVGDKTFYARWKKSLATNTDISISTPEDVTYNGSEFTPAITVTDGETNITNECEISYADNINAGKSTVTIIAKEESNDYAGEATREFTIKKATPTYTIPENLSLKCDQTLSDITLPKGFAFNDINTSLTVGETNTVNATFTPEDTKNYEVVKGIEIKVAVADHVPAETVKENEETPTCETNGSYDEVVYCSVCNKELSRTSKTTDAFGHKYGTPTYTWNDDGKTCTATVVCENDEKHIVTENATITSAVTTPASTESKGTTTYTATFKNSLFKTQTKTIQDIPQLNPNVNPEPNPQPEPEPNNPQPEPNPSTPVTALTEQIEINVWSYNHTIFIENAPDTEYKIIDLNGRVITTSKTKSTREEINVNNTGVLIVIIGNKSFKLAL